LIYRETRDDISPEDLTFQKPQRSFEEMAFGPWTGYDNRVHRTIVRTNASSGSNMRRFQGTYPPAPTIVQSKTAITGGWQFIFNVVDGIRISGYNIYSSLTNNPNIATRVRFMSQPSSVDTTATLTFQEVNSASPFYWVAAINSANKESNRIPASGVASPVQSPTKPEPVGGGSGLGSGGGGGRINRSSLARGL